MQQILAAAFAATILLGAPSAAQEAVPAAGEVVEIEVPAPSLEGNLVGTPTTQRALVYLPPGYADAPERRYPVIFLLHGIFDRGATWVDFAGAPAAADRLIAAGDMPETILVMPDGGNIYGGGFYRNSPVSGNWLDYIADDLMGAIDARYRTLARPGGRAVIGHSMGGYGAIHLAMERPGLVSAIYAIAPCCLTPVEDFGFGNDAWRRAFAFTSAAEAEAALESGDFYPVAGIGVLAAFNPAPDAPPFFVNFPFDIVRGEIVLDQPAYADYLARFPLHRVGNARAALAALRLLDLDYGISDQFQHIPAGTAALSQRLAELRVPHRLEVYDGDHRALVPERFGEMILPRVAAALDRAE